MTISRCILFSCLATVLLANTSCFSKKITSKRVTIAAPKDSDLDGVNDSDDKCPDVKGLANLDGCPDADGDGIADYLDKCPDVIGQARYQGCPVPDTDKDGINDDDDECPTVFGYARYQGCLIPDTDGDGVNDEEDKCIQEAGPVSNKGCPLKNTSDSLKSLDTDGDGVNDLDDKCLTEPGPASNNGCPLVVKINNRTKPGKKNKRESVKNDVAISSTNNGLNSNKPTGVNTKSTPNPGDRTATVSVKQSTKDSIQTSVTPVNAQVSAMFKFTFPEKISEKETMNLTVDLVTSEMPAHAAIKNNDEKQIAPGVLRQNDSTTTWNIPDIATYKKLNISFLYNNEVVDITPLAPENQETKLSAGNSWRWNLEALKSKPGLDTITILINAENEAGLKTNLIKHQLHIPIQPQASVSFWSGKGKWPVIVGSIALIALFLILFAARSKREKQAAGSQK
jgi:hypothetical protein